MMISEKDQETFNKYLRAWSEEDHYHEEIPCSIPCLLRFWEKAKAPFYEMMNNQFIIEQEVSFYEESYETWNKINNSGLLVSDFAREFSEKFKLYFPNHKWMPTYFFSKDCLTTNTFTDNFSLTFPGESKPTRLYKDMKLMKLFNLFVKKLGLNKKAFEDFRILHSQCLNQKKLKGKLCISIHPMDFVTMSDNDCDWETCMHWRAEYSDPGEYRMGTVEMMNSSYVVMAYLKSEEEINFNTNNYEPIMWNNKKWRQLFIVHPKVIMSVKAYPYHSESLTLEVLRILRSLASTHPGYGPYENKPEKIKQYTQFSFSANFMYNDCCGEHWGYIAKGYTEKCSINYSGVAECMFCGEDISFLDPGVEIATSCVVCNNHGGYTYCSECGEKIYNGNYEIVDGEIYCDYCVPHAIACEMCDYITYDEYQMYSVRLMFAENNCFTNHELCESCLNELYSDYPDETEEDENERENFTFFVNKFSSKMQEKLKEYFL